MRTHYGPWQPCWISNQHQKHKSGRGPSSEHFWQVWLKSVQWFQRRRFKCEKLTDGRTLTHDKSSHGLWPGELKMDVLLFVILCFLSNHYLLLKMDVLLSVILCFLSMYVLLHPKQNSIQYFIHWRHIDHVLQLNIQFVQ